MRLVLASASPRRAELLRAAGFVFDTIVVDVDERVAKGERPAEYVRRLAVEKSARAWEISTSRDPGAASGSGRLLVLAADTAVVIDGQILGKPADDDEARQMLHRLSGRTHEVLTGISLRADGQETGCVESTTVEFVRLTPADVAWYVESGEGRDKAGGYAIQGLASRYIPRIRGSYSNVVGLPVSAVHRLVAEIASKR